MTHVLRGAYQRVLDSELQDEFDEWLDDLREVAGKSGWPSPAGMAARDALRDLELAAHEFIRSRETTHMAKRKATRKTAPRSTASADGGYVLPTGRNVPSNDPWEYAYLITGEKKIGKTSFAIQGCEEFVLQFDKPQKAFEIREEMVKSWAESIKIIKGLEKRAEEGDFPYQRVIVDGVNEWYTMCQTAVCKHFGVEHPTEVGYARAWHKLRDDFTDAVNRLLRLQATANCGIVFIAHAEWQEKTVRGGGKIEKLVPSLAPKCEEIVNGKVDAWVIYDYDDKDRVLVIRGDQTTGAGHRIPGHFQTTDGRDVREIHMGESPEESLRNFLDAFENKQTYATIEEMREGKQNPEKKRRRRR